MKILLINVPMFFNSFDNSQAPLGISYIASNLIKNGYEEIKIKDYEVESYSETELLALLKAFEPQIVGISARTSSYYSAIQIVQLLKDNNIPARSVIGGHHSTALTDRVLEETAVDFVVRHEGEITFLELVRTLEKGGNPEEVKGLSFLKDGKPFHTETRSLIADLDSLSFPARELLPMEKYSYSVLLTSRGCPFPCVYCDKNISTRDVRYRSVENVLDELEEIVVKWKKDRVYFIDDHFLLNKKRFFEITDGWLKRGLKFQWLFQARADSVDEEVLKRAKETGCIFITYGIETGDQTELDYLNKGGRCTLAQGEKAVALTKAAGISCRVHFMLGFPVSTHETIRNSIRYAKKLDAENYRFYHVVPLPNTPLWDTCVEKKIITHHVDWSKFNLNEPIIATNDLSLTDLQQYAGAAYIHVFKWKVLKEFSLLFIPNFIKFLRDLPKRKKIASSLFYTFPAFANMTSQLWFFIRKMNSIDKLKFIRDILFLERKL